MTSSRKPRAPGAFIVVVGPDGVGKTTLAEALAAAYPGPTRYFHYRPPLMGSFDVRPTIALEDVQDKTTPPGRGSSLAGSLRLLRAAITCGASHWMRIRPALRRGTLVIGDRWLYGYLTQPEPLKYHGPRWLPRLVLSVLPRPTVVVNLTAPLSVILERKGELTADAIRHELQAYLRLPVRNLITVSSVGSPAEMAAEVLGHLLDSTAGVS